MIISLFNANLLLIDFVIEYLIHFKYRMYMIEQTFLCFTYFCFQCNCLPIILAILLLLYNNIYFQVIKMNILWTLTDKSATLLKRELIYNCIFSAGIFLPTYFSFTQFFIKCPLHFFGIFKTQLCWPDRLSDILLYKRW